MRTFSLDIDEKYFNLLWRSLSEREAELSHAIESDPDSDESALLSNDLVYLRLCMKELREKANQSKFSEKVFSLEEGYIDISEL